MANRIVRAETTDATELLELWKHTFRQAYADVHSRANIDRYCAANFSIDTALATLGDENTVCAFYRRDGKPIGFYIVVHSECPLPLAGKSSELKQIYLLAEAYGSGVGRALFSDSCELIRGEGGEWIWLAVSDLNHRARSFYDKHGFRGVGAGPIIDVGTDRLNSTIMARALEARPSR